MPLTDPNESDVGGAGISSSREPASPAPQPPVADLEHPWLGLESFREEARAYFFGRDAEIAEIHLRLRSRPLLVLYGRSGLGKTSILKAGLVPRLRAEDQQPQVERLDYKKEGLSPVEQLFFALFRSDQGGLISDALKTIKRTAAWEQSFGALIDGAVDTLKKSERISAWEVEMNSTLALPTPQGPAGQLERLDTVPQDTASRLWLRLHWRKDPPETTHLILDQFEEVFTLGAQRPGTEDEVRDALAILLQGAIPEPISRLIAEHDTFLDHFDPDSTPVRVVLALRDDYVYALNRWKRHLPALGQNTFELRALRGPSAFNAVFKPGELRCHYRGEIKEENRVETSLPPIVSEETAQRIVRFVARKKEDVPLEEIEAVPPILSLLCRELNLRRFPSPPDAAPPATQITFREGDTDVETIIATFYERCLARRPEAVRIFIEEELVSYSGARLAQDEQSILKVFVQGCDVPGAADERRAAGYGEIPAARASLQELVNQRLLTSRGDGENPSYELIHDLLATVVEKSRTAREERFEKQQAERRAKTARDAKEAAEKQARTTRKRAIVTTSIVSIAFLIAAFGAWFGFRKAAEAKEQAEEALRQTKVAKTANTRAAEQKARAEKEAEEARLQTKVAETANAQAEEQAKEARLQTEAVEGANARNLQLLHNASMADYAVAVQRIEKDGQWRQGVAHLSRALAWEPANALAARRLYSTVALYAPEKAYLPRVLLSHDGAVVSASFSPDGSKVVTASEDKTARLWDTASGKPLGEPLRHEDNVLSASFSPDGSKVVTTSKDKTARLWDTASGKPLGEPLRHEDNIFSASFSPDGTKVVTASQDKTARLWDTASGKPLGEPLRHEGLVADASFNPDGSKVLTASFDKTARLWDAASGKPLGEPLRHEEIVKSMCFSPDGSKVVTASYHTARLWDTASGKPLGEPLRHDGFVMDATFSPDGSKVVTASEDYTARLWDTASGNPLGKPLRHEHSVNTASFSPDGSKVVTASSDNTARLWDTASGNPLGEPLRHEGVVSGASFSPDGSKVVTASFDKTARLWDTASGWLLGELLRHEYIVWSAIFSPDGSKVLTASSDQTARLWDTASGRPLGEPLRHGVGVFGAIFSPDGSKVVTASDDYTARLWDTASGKPLGELLRHKGRVNSASFSPDGSKVVTASSDQTARLWDAASGNPLGEPLRHEGGVNSASFSPDGSKVVTASDDETARLWETASGKPLGKLQSHENRVQSASFSPDGSKVVTASSDKTARLWDLASGKPLGEPLRHDDWVLSASFSPDGSKVATVSFDHTARLWDTASGKPLGEPLRHEGGVNSASFSPDGSKVVTASHDRTARLWDTASGKSLGEPLRHEGFVWSASFSPDGSKVVTASYDNTARLWDVGVILQPAFPAPTWVSEWARAVSGFEFNADGVMQPLTGGQRIHVLASPHEGNDPWSRLARWVVMMPENRTIHPDSTHIVRTIAERERDFGSEESLQSALSYDPTVPLARLLLAKFEQNPARAAFLREYDLKRLPDDAVLWTRATKALLEQGDKTRALQALERLSKIAPDQARTLKTQLSL